MEIRIHAEDRERGKVAEIHQEARREADRRGRPVQVGRVIFHPKTTAEVRADRVEAAQRFGRSPMGARLA